MVKQVKDQAKVPFKTNNTASTLINDKTFCKFVSVFIELALLVVLIIFTETYRNTKLSVVQSLTTLGVIALFVLIFVLIASFILDRHINYFCIFFVLSYIFSFGQSFGFAFGLLKPSSSVLNIANGYFTSEQILSSGLFVLKASVFFALAYTLFYKRVNINKNRAEDKKANNKKSLRTVGWILFFISAIPTFYLVCKDIFILSNTTYANSKYAVTGIDKIFTLISEYFSAAMVMLLVVENRKSYKHALYFILGAYCILQLLGGSRFDVFKYLVLFVLLYFNNCKKFGLKNIVILIVSVLILGFLFSIISIVRQGEFNSVGAVVQFLISSFKEENVFSKVLYEAGITQIFNTLVYTNCPVNIGYCNGASIYKVFLGIIPNLGFWSVHPTGITTEIVFSELYVDFGLGSSVWMESYWNFGEIGSYIAFFVLGFIFAKLIAKQNKAINANNYVTQFIIYYLMFYFVISVRSDMVQIGRDIVYYVLIPLFVFYCVNKKAKRKVSNNKVAIK